MSQVLGPDGGPVIVATDWIRTLPDLIAPWVPQPYIVLGHGRLRPQRHPREPAGALRDRPAAHRGGGARRARALRQHRRRGGGEGDPRARAWTRTRRTRSSADRLATDDPDAHRRRPEDPPDGLPPGDPRGSAVEVFLATLRLGLTSFGGPIAHIGYQRRAFVVDRGWLSEPAFAELVALCQALPGPASSQLHDRRRSAARGLGGRPGRLARVHASERPAHDGDRACGDPGADPRDGTARRRDPRARGRRGRDRRERGAGDAQPARARRAAAPARRGCHRRPARSSRRRSRSCPDRRRCAPRAPVSGRRRGAATQRHVRGAGRCRRPPRLAGASFRGRRARGGVRRSWSSAANCSRRSPAARRSASSPPSSASGALVFGGGHVVLPLLDAGVVPAGLGDARRSSSRATAPRRPCRGRCSRSAAYLGAVVHGRPGRRRRAPRSPRSRSSCPAPCWCSPPARAAAPPRPAGDRSGAGGANAIVVGVLAAALITPVATSGSRRSPRRGGRRGRGDRGLVAKVPPLAVVAGCARGDGRGRLSGRRTQVRRTTREGTGPCGVRPAAGPVTGAAAA